MMEDHIVTKPCTPGEIKLLDSAANIGCRTSIIGGIVPYVSLHLLSENINTSSLQNEQCAIDQNCVHLSLSLYCCTSPTLHF